MDQKIIGYFTDKNILLVEGKYSRNGVGNDMFDKAASVKRILVPNKNAFAKYDDIKNEVLKNVNLDTLVLLAMGPSAKPLVCDLVEQGYWVLDIGHIDSEYEWFLSKTVTKERTKINKHIAELSDANIAECTDTDYLDSIVADLSE